MDRNDDLNLNAKAKYPSLERVPGKQNWVDKSGGLPSYIDRIARNLHYEKGMTISHSIATAVNTVKRWCQGGTVSKTKGPTKTQNVTAATRAKACAALAQWNAKKAKSGVKAGLDRDAYSDDDLVLELSQEISESGRWDRDDDEFDHDAYELYLALERSDEDVEEHEHNLSIIRWDPRKHPRDLLGRFREVFKALDELVIGDELRISGEKVDAKTAYARSIKRVKNGFEVDGRVVPDVQDAAEIAVRGKEEALTASLPNLEVDVSLSIIRWDPRKHPRDLLGRFREVFNALDGLDVGDEFDAPGLPNVKKVDGGFDVGDGKIVDAQDAAEKVAREADTSDGIGEGDRVKVDDKIGTVSNDEDPDDGQGIAIMFDDESEMFVPDDQIDELVTDGTIERVGNGVASEDDDFDTPEDKPYKDAMEVDSRIDSYINGITFEDDGGARLENEVEQLMKDALPDGYQAYFTLNDDDFGSVSIMANGEEIASGERSPLGEWRLDGKEVGTIDDFMESLSTMSTPESKAAELADAFKKEYGSRYIVNVLAADSRYVVIEDDEDGVVRFLLSKQLAERGGVEWKLDVQDIRNANAEGATFVEEPTVQDISDMIDIYNSEYIVTSEGVADLDDVEMSEILSAGTFGGREQNRFVVEDAAAEAAKRLSKRGFDVEAVRSDGEWGFWIQHESGEFTAKPDGKGPAAPWLLFAGTGDDDEALEIFDNLGELENKLPSFVQNRKNDEKIGQIAKQIYDRDKAPPPGLDEIDSLGSRLTSDDMDVANEASEEAFDLIEALLPEPNRGKPRSERYEIMPDGEPGNFNIYDTETENNFYIEPLGDKWAISDEASGSGKEYDDFIDLLADVARVVEGGDDAPDADLGSRLTSDDMDVANEASEEAFDALSKDAPGQFEIMPDGEPGNFNIYDTETENNFYIEPLENKWVLSDEASGDGTEFDDFTDLLVTVWKWIDERSG